MSRDEGRPSPEAGRDRLPPWRAAALGVLILGGVVAASLVALVAVMTLERWLVPDGDAAEAGHGVALGAFVLVWGLFSLGVLAGEARVMLGRGATLARGDLAAAGLVLLLLGGWTWALHAWVVEIAGYVELDLVGRGTYLWPVVVVLITIALVAVRLARGRIAPVLLGFAALAIGAIFVESVQNALGAIADGDVSRTGLAIGILSAAQLTVLGCWWWVAARRLVGRSDLR